MLRPISGNSPLQLTASHWLHSEGQKFVFSPSENQDYNKHSHLLSDSSLPLLTARPSLLLALFPCHHPTQPFLPGTKKFDGCNHARAHQFYSESMAKPQGFLGFPCSDKDSFAAVSLSQRASNSTTPALSMEVEMLSLTLCCHTMLC